MSGAWTYIWFGFAGAVFAMALVYLVGMTGRAAVTPVRVLLAGVAVGAVMDGIGFVVRLRYPRAFDNMRFWDAGALDGHSLDVGSTIAPFIAVGVVLLHHRWTHPQRHRPRRRSGKKHGRQRRPHPGAEPGRRHLLAGAATAGAGPIGFVGLMVPHAVRPFTGPDWRWILAYSTVVGPTLLLAADIVGRVVIRPAELPAGIVTAFLGAPVLIWLIRKRGADRS